MQKLFIILLLFVLFFPSLNAEINPKLIVQSKHNKSLKMLSNTLVIRMRETSNKDEYYLQASKMNYRIVGEVLPKSLSIRYNKNIKNLALSRNLDIDAIMKAEEPLLRTFFIEYNSSLGPEEFALSLTRKNEQIEFAEPYYLQKLQSYTPNDKFINLQLHLDVIKAKEAWEFEKGKSDVLIGISDNGVYYEHDDLKYSHAVNQNEIPDNGIDDDKNGFMDDYNGYNLGWEYNGFSKNEPTSTEYNHGTNAAGIAQATTDNDIGIAGIGFACKFVPIKIDSDGDTIPFAYQSIIYSAIRGVKVLNLSWGSVQPFSKYNLDVINYAIAWDVALVSAAGNIDDGETWASTYYPAAYPGVLGVGYTNFNDIINLQSSTVGLSCDIFAPGNLFTTDVNGAYTTSGHGTSFTAPVVSGAVALVRSHFPELKAEQALEVVRQSADDIKDYNSYEVKKLIPGRLNMLNAIKSNPLSIPGIKLLEVQLYDTKNNKKVRFYENDTVIIKLKIKNLLGEANGLAFQLSEAHSEFESAIDIFSPKIENINIKSNEELVLDGFKLIVKKSIQQNIILRADISGPNSYKDFFKFLFVPSRAYTDFQNEQIAFSIADNGDFGFHSQLPENNGRGLEYYKKCSSQLYPKSNGLIASVGNKAAYSYYGDFITVKPFEGEDYSTGVVLCDYGTNVNQLGLEIKQKAGFISSNSKSLKIEAEVKNITLSSLNNVSIGYFLDFDLFELYQRNSSTLFLKAIPDTLQVIATAQLIKSKEKPSDQFKDIMTEYPVFGLASISNEPNSHPQAAGLNSSVSSDITYNNIVKALTSGNSWQVGTDGDISAVIGMGFEGELAPNQVKKCAFCFAVGDNEDDLVDELRRCLLNQVDIKYFENSSKIDIYPNPAINTVRISAFNKTSLYADIEIYNSLGIKVAEKNNLPLSNSLLDTDFDIELFNQGTYFLKITFDNSDISFSHFIKVD